MAEPTIWIEQLQQFISQHASADAIRGTVPAAVMLLLVGIVMSVLGAKLARFAVTTAFVVGGVAAGIRFGRELDLPPILCAAGGALLVGMIGFQTFRLWVGLGSALVLSSVVLGFYGYKNVAPHMSEFQQMTQSAPAGGTFTLLPADKQSAYADRTPKEFAEEFWTFLTRKDANIAKNGKVLAATALLTGLCLGVLAMRWALILSTSVIGTALVSASIGTLMMKSVPDSYQSFQGNPKVMGIAIGGFLVTSLILQTMLSRKAAAAKSNSSA